MKKIKQLHSEFMEMCKYTGGLRQETLRGYKSSFDLLVKVFPDLNVRMINSGLMTQFFKKLETRERVVGICTIKRGIKPSTIATYRSKLNRFFDWLVIKGQIIENPFNSMQYPKIEYGNRKFLKGSDVDKIFNAIAFKIDWSNNFVKKRNIAIFSTLLYTGMRRGELLGLKIRDVNFDRGEIVIRGETSKSKRDRSVPIHSQLTIVLKDYLKELREKNYNNPYLFASNNKDMQLTKDGLKHLVNHINKESGVKFHLHQFRHTFAVNLLSAGTDIAKLKQLMGHSDIRMTAVYLRCLPPDIMKGDIESLSLDSLV